MRIFVFTLLIIMIVSCGGGGIGGSSNREYERAVTKAMDTKVFVDLTDGKNNAHNIDKAQFMIVVEGVYRHKSGAFIKLNSRRGTVELYNPEATIEKLGKKEFKAVFPYSVFAANKETLYIKQSNTGTLVVMLNNEEKKAGEFPDLITCIPFMGYGGGRLEVSNIMDGFIAMPSGTYWYKK